MILLYVAASAAVLVWGLRARWRAWRTKRSYEWAETAFRDAERRGKLDEVQLGRPIGYADQLRLLKAFEIREARKAQWTRAANGLARADRTWQVLRKLQGRRASYLSGVFDAGLTWLACHKLSVAADWAARAVEWVQVVRHWA
jgi:hypothetical protein